MTLGTYEQLDHLHKYNHKKICKIFIKRDAWKYENLDPWLRSVTKWSDQLTQLSTGPSKSIQLPISQNATFSAHKIRILEFCIYSIRYKRNICSFILVPALCRHPVFNIQIFTCWLLLILFLFRMRRKLLDTFNRTHDYLRWLYIFRSSFIKKSLG